MNATEIMEKLGWESMVALQILKNKPDTEAFAVCKAADCSLPEMYNLGELGLIDPGFDRIEPKRSHPVLTDLGREVLDLCESKGIV